jgi:hypothetical protein
MVPEGISMLVRSVATSPLGQTGAACAALAASATPIEIATAKFRIVVPPSQSCQVPRGAL